MKTGFDNEKYLKEQTAEILDRVRKFNNKLYLEFGGKLCYDYHAARVLPGYDPNVKIKLLQELKEKVEIILCIFAGDIEKGRIRGDFGITYDIATLKLMDDLRKWNLDVTAVLITRFDSQPLSVKFKNKLERRGIKVYTHGVIKGYPVDTDAIVSDEGLGKNEYIPTKKPIVIITAPGPGSGKLATCFSQMYHDHKKGMHSGYAKFETFPIWNLPLKHPVNIAYEAATADILDFNLVDPFHLSAYNKVSVNYNRDVESFPILAKILQKILGESAYKSPTDIGVNRVGFGIIDDEIVQEAAKQEIIRRFLRYNCEYFQGIENEKTVEKAKKIMEELGLKPEGRGVVLPARKAADDAEKKGKGNKGVFCGAAIQLPDGRMITGKNSPLMHAASSLVINAIKALSNIPDGILLLSPNLLSCIAKMKEGILGAESESLSLDEALTALSISAATNHTAEIALKELEKLRGCEVHMTHIPTPGDEAGLKRLGVNLTTDANFSSANLFVI